MLSWWPIAKATAESWVQHKSARLGAALAYYSVFSIGPLILITIATAGLVFGAEAVRGEVALQLNGLLGDAGANAVEAMLSGADHPRQGVIATVFGIGLLVFAALGVVIQLKDALNTIWDVQSPPGSTLWQFARSYLISLASILSLGFLLLVSLVFTTALAAAGKYVSPFIPEVSLQLLGSLTSFAFVTIMFAMMFKWLPDTAVAWRDVWLGAAFTAVFFEIGKSLIGIYIGKLGLESTYGGAASLVVVLIWVYYSSQIVLLGAEFTHVYGMHRANRADGHRLSAPDQLSS